MSLNELPDNLLLIWYAREISEADKFDVTIIDKRSYCVLYYKLLSEENFINFKQIMKLDRYSVRYVEHEELGEAAKIKLKLSPHKEIINISKIRMAKESKEYYLGY